MRGKKPCLGAPAAPVAELVEPAPLLIPFKYNNPKLLRFLVRNRFEGFLTVNYERSAVDVRWLVREFLNLREQLATLEEKED